VDSLTAARKLHFENWMTMPPARPKKAITIGAKIHFSHYGFTNTSDS
jgi:hypothetical protein